MAAPHVERRLVTDAFDLIADEVGVSRSELFDGTDFLELGIDDVLAKNIISKVRETLELDLVETAFKDFSNAEDLQNHIKDLTKHQTTPSTPLAARRTPTHAPRKTASTKPAGPLSILLQGKPGSAKKTIFLLPDGSGSGMSYARLPAIAPDVCLIGMNSPFLNKTGDFTSTIEELATMWVHEIRQRQPSGPYILGGWSAGGYYSFEVSKQLIQQGETVAKLILIDSPCRLVFEPLPIEAIHFLIATERIGNWGSKKPPQWFVDHFSGTIDAVGKYMPTPMDVNGRNPQVYIIWCADGVLDDTDAASTGLDLNMRVTRFLLQPRNDFGPHGWDKLIPGTTVSIAKMPGNHFTIVHPPNSISLTTLLRDVVRDGVSKNENHWQVMNV